MLFVANGQFFFSPLALGLHSALMRTYYCKVQDIKCTRLIVIVVISLVYADVKSRHLPVSRCIANNY